MKLKNSLLKLITLILFAILLLAQSTVVFAAKASTKVTMGDH